MNNLQIGKVRVKKQTRARLFSLQQIDELVLVFEPWMQCKGE